MKQPAMSANTWPAGRDITGPQGEQVVFSPDQVTLHAPVPKPHLVRDTMSFEGHMKNFEKITGKPSPPVWYQRPSYYKGNPGNVIGPDEPVVWPPFTNKLDYELNLASISANRAGISRQTKPTNTLRLYDF